MKTRTYVFVIVASMTAMLLLQSVLRLDDPAPPVVAEGDNYAEREEAWQKVVAERETTIGRLRAAIAGRAPVSPDTIVVYDTIVAQDTVYLVVQMDGDGQLEVVTGVAVDSAEGFKPTREVYGLEDCDDGFTLVPGSRPVCDKPRAGHLWLGAYAGARVDSLVVALPAPWLEPAVEWQPTYRSAWRVHVGYDVFSKSVRAGLARGVWVW